MGEEEESLGLWRVGEGEGVSERGRREGKEESVPVDRLGSLVEVLPSHQVYRKCVYIDTKV